MRDLDLRVFTKFILPFILILGLYIQLFGSSSPGGGFGAGAIIASGYILYGLVFGQEKLEQIISLKRVKTMLGIGMLSYILVGISGMLFGENFLSYNIFSDVIFSQELGILTVELAIGFIVFSALMLIYYCLV